MEVVGAAANVFSLVDVALRTTSVVISYAQQIAHSTEQRQLLANEASALYSTLEQLQSATATRCANPEWLVQHERVLLQMKACVAEMGSLLKLDPSKNVLLRESRYRALATTAKWPSTKADAYVLLQQISRLQSYSNSIVLHDNQ